MRRVNLSSTMVSLLGGLTIWTAPLVAQETSGMAPLPADPPIGGVVWTVFIPAILLIGSFLATYLLYRRFSTKEDEG